MNKIVIDFETYCDLDIKKVGAFKYTDHPSCRILCMSYKLNDEEVKVWTPDQKWPEELKDIHENTIVYAFSATFEYLVWNTIGCKDHPKYFKTIPLYQFIDVKALCARYKMPQSLGKAAIALKCNTEKMVTGTRLIRICCMPDGSPTEKDYQDLYEYCRIDTVVTHEILQKLPSDHLIESEQQLWELTFKMNKRGVPIDKKAVQSIVKYLAGYMEDVKKILPEITDNYVQTPGQIQKIREYCAEYDIVLPNLQIETVNEYLDKEDLPDNIRQVLEIRKLAGKTSVKKFITILNLENKEYVQGNLNYHGAGTGRWSGQGFQYHNLPRAKKKNPEKWIDKFINNEKIDDPVGVAKALIRPMIKAPEGYQLIVSDYSSIENRVLAWLCFDNETLRLFKYNHCQYTDMAAYLYNVHPNDIDKKSTARQMGKVIILGCGYQMGAKRFQATAKGWGFDLSFTEADRMVKAYRSKYPLVVKLWRELSNVVMYVTLYRDASIDKYHCNFRVVQDKNNVRWLRITLPSGRSLMYSDPKVIEGAYGKTVSYIGLNATTHQMGEQYLSPGLITENIVQAIARDILAVGMMNINTYMPEVELSISVHDEAGGLIKEEDINETVMNRFNDYLCTMPKWVDGLPLKAEGYIAKRYRKD